MSAKSSMMQFQIERESGERSDEKKEKKEKKERLLKKKKERGKSKSTDENSKFTFLSPTLPPLSLRTPSADNVPSSNSSETPSPSSQSENNIRNASTSDDNFPNLEASPRVDSQPPSPSGSHVSTNSDQPKKLRSQTTVLMNNLAKLIKPKATRSSSAVVEGLESSKSETFLLVSSSPTPQASPRGEEGSAVSLKTKKKEKKEKDLSRIQQLLRANTLHFQRPQSPSAAPRINTTANFTKSTSSATVAATTLAPVSRRLSVSFSSAVYEEVEVEIAPEIVAQHYSLFHWEDRQQDVVYAGISRSSSFSSSPQSSRLSPPQGLLTSVNNTSLPNSLSLASTPSTTEQISACSPVFGLTEQDDATLSSNSPNVSPNTVLSTSLPSASNFFNRRHSSFTSSIQSNSFQSHSLHQSQTTTSTPTYSLHQSHSMQQTSNSLFSHSLSPATSFAGGAHSTGQMNFTTLSLHVQDDNPANTPLQIQYATLDKLIERLTTDKFPDPRFSQLFLLTYHSFTNASHLLQLLIYRFNMPTPPDYPEPEVWMREKRRTVRLKVINVLRSWISKFFGDFSDPQLKEMLHNFINSRIASLTGYEQMAEGLNALIVRKEKEREEEAKQKQAELKANEELMKKNFQVIPYDLTVDISFRSVDAVTIGAQLTCIEFHIFRKIEPKECLKAAWNKPNKSEIAPNVRAMIDRFNYASRWFATEVILTRDTHERAVVISKIISVAKECHRLNNFNGVMEICAGLQATSVYRLKKTWELVPSSHMESLRELQALVSHENNFENLRRAINLSTLPCIPYLGTFLTDLTFLEEGNSDFNTSHETGERLINWRKFTMTADVIMKVMTYKSTPYSIQLRKDISEWLCNATILDEKELLYHSLLIEPRQKKSTCVS